MIIKQNSYSGHLLQMGERKQKMGKEEIRYRELDLKVLERKRERERLLSKISGDPTIGILRSKKQSCSTRRGLRMGSGFGSF